jgi:hypothetical protein
MTAGTILAADDEGLCELIHAGADTTPVRPHAAF